MKIVKELSELYFDYLEGAAIQKSPESLYEPVNYIMELGGKRIRPILVLMAANMFEEKIESRLSLAHAVEMFHNFTLVHDDIMDEALIRRGKATVHVKYNLPTAILSGDVMLLKTYESILKYSHLPWCNDALAYFTEIGIKICEGQQWDMEFEEKEEVSFEDYSKMIKYKTAVLLGACMKLGAMSVGASEKDQNLLEGFAVDLGMAFQIQDDILDSFGQGAMIGKEVGGDIYRGKKTFLYVCGLEGLGEEREDFKKAYLSTQITKEQKFERVHAYFNKANVEEKAKEIQQKYFESAIDKLNQISVEDSKKNELRLFATSLFIRDL